MTVVLKWLWWCGSDLFGLVSVGQTGGGGLIECLRLRELCLLSCSNVTVSCQ